MGSTYTCRYTDFPVEQVSVKSELPTALVITKSLKNFAVIW